MNGTEQVHRRHDQFVDVAIKRATERLSLSLPSLRSVARDCGVTPTAVYRYFPSQSSLNRAILVTIDSSFITAVAGVDDPRRTPLRRLQVFADAYIDWGLANPGLYQLRFESADQLGKDFIRTDAADDLLAHVDTLIDAVDPRLEVCAEDLWLAVHGVVSLHIHKPERPWPVAPHQQVQRFFHLWGLRDEG
ncbi:TetR/AcrR family transcriptional regulator [Actinoplanes sp. TFC3]|uniref:TetR/AcrR family transcriptional regulator n=1 Tax=Actinoplanes sp. TFC3 TaxID=1710355 RepID=UPI000B113121|nr:TetR-like C-terminal domain-containing protein [Actinoplanes sp. TFC3]